jgi:hypothetical protein
MKRLTDILLRHLQVLCNTTFTFPRYHHEMKRIIKEVTEDLPR